MIKDIGNIVAISVSSKTGIPKDNVETVRVEKDYGIVGDAHSGTERQISLLAYENIKDVQNKGLDVKPGDFAENITVTGVNFSEMEIGAQVKIGEEIILEITQKGKTCHSRCWIHQSMGDCIMPKNGVFAKVLNGGNTKVGDKIGILYKN